MDIANKHRTHRYILFNSHSSCRRSQLPHFHCRNWSPAVCMFWTCLYNIMYNQKNCRPLRLRFHGASEKFPNLFQWMAVENEFEDRNSWNVLAIAGTQTFTHEASNRLIEAHQHTFCAQLPMRTNWRKLICARVSMHMYVRTGVGR